ncbi:MAG: iron-sulfur cluster assembly accessory protein [Alphaproteobacteria bacterium]|nr:iron-sulfur cluster assembly accessory protein [Alphaproteobacteria bacterium]MBF0332667.1 iron-sulfur cluster assembly accessory protein [Alphaproteobacteria bacterium]
MLVLTEGAIEAVRQVIKGSDEPVAGLRVMVEAGGCQGMRYQLGLEAEMQPDDAVLDFGGVKVFLDPVSAPLLDGVAIDYVDNLEGAGFVFDNPGAKAQCGCGKSFAC